MKYQTVDGTVIDLSNVVAVSPVFSFSYTVTTLFGVQFRIIAVDDATASADRVRLLQAWGAIGQVAPPPPPAPISAPIIAEPAMPVASPVPIRQAPPPPAVPAGADDVAAALAAAGISIVDGIPTEAPTGKPSAGRPAAPDEGPYVTSFL